MVLYRKYRPQTFAEIVGQEHIKSALLQALAAGTIGHAYLFCGTRGSGKTSTARILAKALNCERLASSKLAPHSDASKLAARRLPLDARLDPCNTCSSCIAITNGSHMDVIEIDAASNRGIDDIRELRERMKLSTSQGRKKVYIIDEVHMLTNEAFNALLKTLEEPPSHVVLILATTEPRKVPQTILSRCQRLDFSLATTEELALALQNIIVKEKITITADALSSVAVLADGSFRDAIKMLDQLASSQDAITAETVARFYHTPKQAIVAAFLGNLIDGKTDQALGFIAERHRAGDNLREVTFDILRLLRTLLYAKVGIATTEGSTVTSYELSEKVDRATAIKLLRLFSQAEKDQKVTSLVQLPLELAVMEWIEGKGEGLRGKSENTQVNKEQRLVPRVKRQEEKLATTEKTETNENTKNQSNDDERRPARSVSPSVAGGAMNDEPIDPPPPEEIGAMLAEESDSIAIATAEKITETITEVTVLDQAGADLSDSHLVLLKEHWPRFMTRMIELNHSMALLLKNATITDFDGEYLTLEVLYKFHKERLEQDKLRHIIEDTLSEMVNQPVRLRCLIKERSKIVGSEEDLTDLASQVFGGEVE